MMENTPIYTEIPPIVAYTTSRDYVYVSINFHIQEVDGGYTCDSVAVKLDHYPGDDDYPAFVSALVRFKYSQDDMEAMLCNYDITPRTEKVKQDMAEMQAWRAESKEIAQEAIEYIKSNS